VLFAERQGKTEFTLRHSVGSIPASEREMCREGWREMLDKFSGYLTKG